MRTPARNLHVPLDAGLYEALIAEARRAGVPATVVARQAIARLVEERRQRALEQELEAYVRANAGTCEDLDPGLEAAGIEHMLGRPPRRRSRK